MISPDRVCRSEWSPGDVRNELERGSRVVLLIRHAERPKIDRDDRTFGAALPLTDAGRDMAVRFGRLVAGSADSVCFVASPLRRTVETARLVARGMGLGRARVVRDATIGNSSAFVADELEIWKLFRDGGFFTKMREYMDRGEQRGFNPIAKAADEFEERLVSLLSSQLGIFTSHDIYVAAFLHARGVKTDFDFVSWPRFMDSAAIVIPPEGPRRYALVRAGLSSLCTGVETPRPAGR